MRDIQEFLALVYSAVIDLEADSDVAVRVKARRARKALEMWEHGRMSGTEA